MLSQLITAVRLVMGAEALILAIEGDNLALAGTLIALSVVIESVAERAAAWLNSASPFNERFAEFVDFTTFIITPWVLTRALLIGRRNMVQEVLLDLPLLAGAIRYARQTRIGLSPVVIAFVGAIGVLLQIQELISVPRLTMILPPVVAALSVLMVAPLRYRPLPMVPAMIALALVAAMPFFQTELLAGVAIIGGVIYVVVGPFLGSKT